MLTQIQEPITDKCEEGLLCVFWNLEKSYKPPMSRIVNAIYLHNNNNNSNDQKNIKSENFANNQSV